MSVADPAIEMDRPLAQMEAECHGPTPPEFRWYVIRVCRRGHIVTPWSGRRHGSDFWECVRCESTAALLRAVDKRGKC